MTRPPTIWQLLEECVATLSPPFRASEILGWFRRHHPEVQESSLRAHIQVATSNASAKSRGAFASRRPLLTRIDHGVYVRYVGEDGPPRQRPRTDVPATRTPPTAVDQAWHGEAHVQARVVAHLVNGGWQILSVANTATRERGIDIIASKDGATLGVEVKGYPGRQYSAESRRGEAKSAHPSGQAAAYYAQAILSALRQRHQKPNMRSVIALPATDRYETLLAETRDGLATAGVAVWLVDEQGTVTE